MPLICYEHSTFWFAQINDGELVVLRGRRRKRLSRVCFDSWLVLPSLSPPPFSFLRRCPALLYCWVQYGLLHACSGRRRVVPMFVPGRYDSSFSLTSLLLCERRKLVWGDLSALASYLFFVWLSPTQLYIQEHLVSLKLRRKKYFLKEQVHW